MRIGILGAGGIGSVIAALLSRTSHEVVLVARGDHFAAIERDGLEVSGAIEAHGVPQLVASGGELPTLDMLLLTTKTYDSSEALARVDPAKVAAVASLQNGIAKDNLLTAHFGPEKVIGGATMIGGERTGPGQVRCSLLGRTYFGEFDGAASPRLQAIREAFEAGGLPVEVDEDIRSIEWTKQVLQAATAPLAALIRQPLHALYSGPAASLVRDIVVEGTAVAAAHRIELNSTEPWNLPLAAMIDAARPDGIALARATGAELAERGATNVRISMEQDVVAGRKTELEETAGWVVRESQRLGVAAPTLEIVCTAVRALTETSPNGR